MYKNVNRSPIRLDAREKVTGKVKFAADLNFGNQLYARTVYSAYPHAEIVALNTKKAAELEGIVAVITADDVPGENSLFGRFPVLAGDEVKYIGDGVAVVAGETREVVDKAVKLVEVEYRELPGVYSLEEALEGAPPVHADREDNIIEGSHHLMRAGDTEEGFAEADVILERTYKTQFIDQGYIEPEAVIVLPDPYRRGIEIQGCIQNPYSIRENVAKALNLKISEVKVIQSTIGGSFGGKDESVMLMAARMGIIALNTGRPVKMVLTREESLAESAKRHPYRGEYKIGATEDGKIVAVTNKIYSQGGAYNNKAMFANWRCSVHAAGPYAVPHVKTDVYGVYTNTIYGGAMRGFSAPQTAFFTESLMDELAEELEMSPEEIRLKNCLQPGDEMATGQKVGDEIPAPLKEMITDVCRKTNFRTRREEISEFNKQDKPVKKGIGLACTFRGAGLGGEGIDTAGARVTIDKDGSVNIQSDLTEMGQGMRTAHAQIVAEVLGISLERITFSNTDTSFLMDGGPTVASRGTLAGGNAMFLAARKLKKRLHRQAAEELNCSPDEIVSEDDRIFEKGDKESGIHFNELINICLIERGLSLSAQGWYNPGPEELSHETGRGNAYPTYVYGVSVAEVEVNTETGMIDVKKVTAAYDVGTAVNPQLVKGQFYGGILQGLGYGIMEEVEEREGYLQTENFDDLLLPTSMDMPELEVILYETDDEVGPFGAKSVGEVGIELIAPTIANAVYQATGRRIRELPLNLERVLLGRELKK